MGCLIHFPLRLCADSQRFDVCGRGCRHWCAVLLETLAEGGFVDADVGELFRKYEQDLAEKFGEMVPMPRIVGSFYDL